MAHDAHASRGRGIPFWRHDAYTSRRLAAAITSSARRVLAGVGGRKVAIDLGAGTAPYRSVFESMGVEYLACDLDADPPYRLVPGSMSDLPAASAAAVLSFQVLEHVWDLDWYLGEARRLLAPEGTLILSTHGAWLYHPHPTDYRRWTHVGLQRELETRGFAVSSIVPVVGPLAWTTQFRALGYSHFLRKIPVLGWVLEPVVNTIFHLRMMIEDAITPSAIVESNAAVYVVVATHRADGQSTSGT